ncbi:MAG: adenylate/guanylate cyclase domain-containing protein [Alphaproteobacteria bacterium]|nr:adenylate/guanylate cyclase domain-containing protein [Alphaproteobacteria bacterium]MCW5740233.1 adenylate/guanylate cyclase domain-containing protein [Alphaproteobacteria bacterium]
MTQARRYALVVLGLALLAGAAVATPPFDGLRGWSLDLLTGLRWAAFGNPHPPESSPVVVIALDEETYRTPPFEGTPSVTWTRELGRVLAATVDGGAAVVGFDIVFPVSIEQSQIPLGDETLGARVRGFDRDYLRALALAARAGKVVLGQVQHSDKPIRPSPGQRVAVGQQRNIRALNAYSDPDDVVRRMPLSFTIDGVRVPSMSVELASRALGQPPEWGSDGALTLSGYRVPSAVANTLTVNFAGGADNIPTYSLADLRACAEKGDTEFFRRQFAGKVVLLGTLLDVEDRRITSKRFATGAELARAPRCVNPVPASGAVARPTISGVYLHASAVSNLIRRDAVVEAGRPVVGAIAFVLAVLAAVAALSLSPARAALAWLAGAVLWTALATAVFRGGLALPLLQPLVASSAVLVLAIAWRFMVADKDKRLLRQSFALYLAPAVIDRMLASSRPPELGGETRIVTIFFSDVAGFSSFSERMPPHEVVALMNEYLSAMTDIIEAEGGFVDKYIGDAIVAVFGAPAEDAGHAASAVRAALRCQARLAELNATIDAFRAQPISQRIGLNSGEALVGNIGSRRRFNYTVMGDAVNLASRLEGANKYFGTSIIASQATVDLAGAGFAWRELDLIRVKGRAQPVRIHEALAQGEPSEQQRAHTAAYAAGLAHWRAADFKAAADEFGRNVSADPASAAFHQRALSLVANPPGAGWEPVNTLDDK